MMSWLWILVGLVALQRLAELVYARRNTERLLARGAKEIGAGHYPLLVALHTAWLLAILFWVPGDRAPYWSLVAVFLLLQAMEL